MHNDAFTHVSPSYGSVIVSLTDDYRDSYACEQWSWNDRDETARVRYYVNVWDRNAYTYYRPVCQTAEEAIGLADLLNRRS